MSLLQIKLVWLPHGIGIDLPAHQTVNAAAMDIRAAIGEDRPVVLVQGARALIPTGFMVAIEPGFEMQIRPRSGLALKHGITVLNSPGTIDPDYRGEVGVILINLGQEAFTINRGDRIAQIVIAKIEHVVFNVVDQLDLTDRQAGGFGSTGRN